MLHSIVNSSKVFLNHSFLKFTCGVLLTQQKKTCPAIAKTINISVSKIYRMLGKQKTHASLFAESFFDYIRPFSKNGYFIIDDSVINKQFSAIIQGTSETFDSITNMPCLGLSVVTLGWTDGTTVILVAYRLWYNKDVANEAYKTKTELAKELILSIPDSIDSQGILFDGLYATEDMMKFLVSKDINFVARAASNKVADCDGQKKQLKKHPSLRLRKNEHSRTVKAKWRSLDLYFTVEKRKDKNGEVSIVFIVSNFKTSSKDYVRIYKLRWGIEVFYRTSKQSLGLKDCQSTDLDMQKVRIYNLFYVYAFLQHQKKLQDALNIEAVIHSLQLLKQEDVMTALTSFNQIFHAHP